MRKMNGIARGRERERRGSRLDTRAVDPAKLKHRVEKRPRHKRKNRLLPTRWPKVGGPDLDTRMTGVFATAEFTRAYQPGETRIIYAAGCPALGALSRRISVPNYKVSTCAEDGLSRRMSELRRDEVGAYVYRGGEYVHEEGWVEWFPSHLYPLLGSSPDSPVVAEERAIVVRLPIGMTATVFDSAFDAQVRLGAMDLWAMTEVGMNHCRFLNVDPNDLQRFTAYPRWRIMPVQEIVGFSIFSSVDRLIRIAEQIIVKAVGLEWTALNRNIASASAKAKKAPRRD